MHVAFALDCGDRESMRWVATSSSIDGVMVRDLMLEAIKARFGNDPPPRPIEWLTDNGSPYIAHDTRAFAGELGLVPVTAAIRSPQRAS